LAGHREVEVSDEVLSLLMLSKHYHEVTDGLFNIMALPLIKHIAQSENNKEKQSHQTPDEIRSITDIHKMKLDSEKSTAYLEKKGMMIDLGGIGKGIALLNIERILSEKEISNAFISFGESSILAKGRHPYGDCWKIGIRHIKDSSQNVYSLELRDTSLSTSGITSKELREIVNPKTGELPDSIKTTSVVSKSPVDAEVLSTALLVANDKNMDQVINKFSPEMVAEIRYNKNDQPTVKELYNSFGEGREKCSSGQARNN
jgi:thiamine biosynthesis lipoprotein